MAGCCTAPAEEVIGRTEHEEAEGDPDPGGDRRDDLEQGVTISSHAGHAVVTLDLETGGVAEEGGDLERAEANGADEAASGGGQSGQEQTASERSALVQEQARLVREHEEEVLMQHFHRWILLFSLIICLATPAMIGLLVWLIVSYIEDRMHREGECDAPLRLWVHVVFLIVAFNSTINRPTPTGSCVQRYICGWRREPGEHHQPMPARVRMYNLVVTVFVFIWNCAGLKWVSMDGTMRGDYPPCREVAPSLYISVKVYAAFNLAITLFMYVNMFGFAQLLRMAIRRGLLHTTEGAPQGSLEERTEEAKLTDPAVAENPTCPICFDNFDEATPFVKTKGCGHLFHKKCLKGWLNVNRSCPLCREDLSAIRPRQS